MVVHLRVFDKMFRLLVLSAFFNYAFGGLFDFTGFDDPYYNNFFFNRPAVIIRQHHGRCTTTQAGASQEGVCLSRPECTLSGGQSLGRQSCLLGTCCIYARGCNQISTRRISYFEGNLNNDIDSCTYTVRVENNNICQMRLDFDSLNLPIPTRDRLPGANNMVVETGPYICRDAAFVVESPNSERIPTLCGNNNGQHIYVSVNASRGERDLIVKVINNLANTNNNGASLNWRIKITQLECPGIGKQKSSRAWEDAQLIAPEGCLQYYLNPSGTIRNLGFDSGLTPLTSNHYEANMYYATCFRRAPDVCGIDFSVNQFSLSGQYDPATNVYCNQLIAGTTLSTDTDYLFVPNGYFTTTDATGAVTVTNRDKYCGLITQNSIIRSVTPGPLYIFFRTDNQVLDLQNMPATPPDPENGWELTYTILRGTSCGLFT